MKELSKIATTHDVQAYLSGRKTQFRELVKWTSFSENKGGTVNFEIKKGNIWNAGSNVFADSLGGAFFGILEFAKYRIGSLVYLRESITHNSLGGAIWKAGGKVTLGRELEKDEYIHIDDIDKSDRGYVSAVCMKKKHARIWMEITAVKVERVQDISEADCLAEGIVSVTKDGNLFKYCHAADVDSGKVKWSDMPRTAKEVFQSLRCPDSWNRNDYVFAYEVKLLSTSGKPVI